MQSARKKLILSTVLKTVIALVLIVILFLAIFSLSAPSGSSDFFYSIGFKKMSARTGLREAQKSGLAEDYYTALVRANAAKSFDIAVYAGEILLNRDDNTIIKDTDYSDFVEAKDKELGCASGATANYIETVYVYALMRTNKGCDEKGGIWAKTVGYCEGKGGYHFYNSVCPATAYVNAVIDSKKADDATIYGILLNFKLADENLLFGNANQFDWITTTVNTFDRSSSPVNYVDAQEAMAGDIARLIKAKGLTRESAETYAAEHGEKYVTAFNYWYEIINANTTK